MKTYICTNTYIHREGGRGRGRGEGREGADRERERERAERDLVFFSKSFVIYSSLPIHLIFDIWYSILQQKTIIKQQQNNPSS